MKFLYFAYGSNTWPPQMHTRCPSATFVATSALAGWEMAFDKPSRDGSAKLNIRRSDSGSVPGVIYEIDDDERSILDLAEDQYAPITAVVDGSQVLTYAFGGEATDTRPYDWYREVALAGAGFHGLSTEHLEVEVTPDPIAPGLRPAGLEDLPRMQMIVRAGLARGDGGYSAHPGELAWWMYHPDPRYPDHITYWLQEDRGFLLLDSRNSEIGVFTLPGVDRWPLIDWAQTRRLDQSGDVGWVPDDDEAFVGELRSRGYRPIHVERSYRWDLENTPVPNPELPPGWSLRALQGEHEANSRREASHRAFESTMGDQAHLERYLKFMRSPAYSIQNDLVALTPTGRVASFMVWWPDGSGVAQIEPFGTHPEFQRQGVGRALLHFALRRMKDEGMRSARVFTDEKSEATTFYEGIGFTDVGAVRWWAKKS